MFKTICHNVRTGTDSHHGMFDTVTEAQVALQSEHPNVWEWAEGAEGWQAIGTEHILKVQPYEPWTAVYLDNEVTKPGWYIVADDAEGEYFDTEGPYADEATARKAAAEA